MKYILAVVVILSCFCISCSDLQVQLTTSSTDGDPARGKDKIALGTVHVTPFQEWFVLLGLVEPPLMGNSVLVRISLDILLNNSENIARASKIPRW